MFKILKVKMGRKLRADNCFLFSIQLGNLAKQITQCLRLKRQGHSKDALQNRLE